MTWISKSYTSEEFGHYPTVNQKIEVFRDRVLGWQIDVADAVRERIDAAHAKEAIKHAGYALVSILFSYFEMIAQYERGESSYAKSKRFFVYGVRSVFPTSKMNDDQIALVYVRVRCGMFHSGYTKIGTLLHGGFSESISVQDDTVLINPHRLVADIRQHFLDFIATLRDDSNNVQREKFERTFDAGLKV